MELLNSINSVQALVIMLGLLLLSSVGKFVFGLLKKKTDISDEAIKSLTDAMNKNTVAINDLKKDFDNIEDRLSEVKKLKKDLRRFYIGFKMLSADRWPEISKAIQEDEEFLN